MFYGSEFYTRAYLSTLDGFIMRARLLSLTIAVAAYGASFNVLADQADIDAELSRYTTIIKGTDYAAQRELMKRLEWAGYSSNELYDAIASELTSRKDSTDSAEIKQAAWYARSLASSGSEKYRPVLEDVAANAHGKNVRKHANYSLDKITKYRTWNAVISNGLIQAPSGRLEQTRVANLLRADDVALLKTGAKRVYHEFNSDADLLTQVRQRLTVEWNRVDAKDGDSIDAVAWLIKAIGYAGDSESQALLTDIQTNSKIKKLVKYAKKSLKS